MGEEKMKLTKATIKRINKFSDITKPEYNERIGVIGRILNRCNVLIGYGGNYEANDGSFGLEEFGIYESRCCRTESEYEKRLCRGMYTRYPFYIQVQFTLGLNSVEIVDANALVREILRETD